MTSPDTGGAGRGAAMPSRERILIELGQELRAMRTELGDAVGKFDVVVRDVSEVIGPDVATLRAQVAAIRGELDALLEEPENEEEAPTLHWPDLSMVDAAEAWTTLEKWVDTTLGYWFGVTRGQLPDCWPLHRPALLQLWALHLVYVSAHEGGRASAGAMIEWNTRWLDSVLAKVKQAIPDTLCRVVAGQPGEHDTPRHAQRQQPPSRVRGTAAAATSTDPIAQVQAKLRRSTSPYPVTPSAGGAQPPAAAGTEAGAAPGAWTGTSAEDEVTSKAYWGDYLKQAREADLKWRHARDTAVTAAEATAAAPGT